MRQALALFLEGTDSTAELRHQSRNGSTRIVQDGIAQRPRSVTISTPQSARTTESSTQSTRQSVVNCVPLPAKLVMKHVARAVVILAELGPSGRTNDVIAGTGRMEGGPETRADRMPKKPELGEQPLELVPRKLRTILLAEALMKLPASCDIAPPIETILSKVEPKHLGLRSPDAARCPMRQRMECGSGRVVECAARRYWKTARAK